MLDLKLTNTRLQETEMQFVHYVVVWYLCVHHFSYFCIKLNMAATLVGSISVLYTVVQKVGVAELKKSYICFRNKIQ